MQVISEDKINDIRNSADIVSIISDYVPLKIQGKNYFGVCPFHDDHSPSMSVSPERQLFKCFVCNKGGNVFTFVKDYENITYFEAVKKVADKVGIPLDYNPVKKQDSKYKLEYEIMDYSTKIFQNNLNSKEGVKAREYLNKRSINDDIIKEFRIGLSLNNNTYLYNVLSKKNYNINTLDDLGLITKDGLNGYDRFVNRIMIPICDINGNVVGFTGRIFNNEDSAKYINTKAILVEGNMDAIRMYSSGIKNVLALMGTALTKEQVDIIKKLRVPIILMLDNDSAGELATNNVGDELTRNNIEVKVVRLDEAKDPDEYIIKFGVNAFIDTIKHSLNYFDYKLNYLKENKNLNNTDELISYVKSVLQLLDGKDNLTKEITIKKISNDYNIDYELLKKEINIEENIKQKIVINTKTIKKDKYNICINRIFYYMMSDSKYLDIFNAKLGYLKNKEERYLVTEIEYYIKKYGKINFADFISYAENDNNIRDLVNNISNSISFNDLDEKEFLEYINALKDIINKEEIKKLKEELIRETDINKQVLISKRITELKKGSVKDGRN